MNVLDRMVASKRSPAVLRMDIIRIGGRYPEKKMLVFEGVEDVGVYSAWIKRCRDGNWFCVVPGAGKKQLLNLLRELRQERSELLSRVRFFVDHDFDGVSSSDRCEYLFVTDRYSIENYLVDRRVIADLLVDDLRCALYPGALDRALHAFDNFMSQLNEALRDPMAMYRAGVLIGAKCVKKPEKLNGNLRILLDGVEEVGTWNGWVEFDPPPSPEILRESSCAVQSGGISSYRGKWLFHAVRAWLGMVYVDRRSDHPKIFRAGMGPTGPAPDSISLQSLAARSPMPTGLHGFLSST